MESPEPQPSPNRVERIFRPDNEIRALKEPDQWLESFNKRSIALEDLDPLLVMSREYMIDGVIEEQVTKTGEKLWKDPNTRFVRSIFDVAHQYEWLHRKHSSLEDDDEVLGLYTGSEVKLMPKQLENRVERLFGEDIQNGEMTIGEARLITYVKTAAHEMGHATSFGVIGAYRGGNGVSRGSSLYLVNHPEQYVTGDLETDAAIFEERFAEGFGRIAIDQLCRKLNYPEDKVQKIGEKFDRRLRRDSDYPVRGHTIEELSSLEHGKPFRDDTRDWRKNIEIGYEYPLTVEEIYIVMDELHEMLREHGGDPNMVIPSLSKYDRSAWKERTENAQPIFRERLLADAACREQFLSTDEAEHRQKTRRNLLGRVAAWLAGS